MKKIKKLLLFGAVCALSFCFALPTYAQHENELREAAKDGNIEYVKKYVGMGAYVDGKDDHERTALYFAVKYDRVDVVKYLIEEAKANPNLDDSLLLIAKSEGMFVYLFEHGATIKDPRQAALRALKDENYWLVNCIIDHYSLDREEFINYVAQDLMKYSYRGENEICKLLDIGLLNPKNNAFYAWAFSRNYSIAMNKMKKLSNDEVKLDFKNCDNKTKKEILKSALFCSAVCRGDIEALNLFIQNHDCCNINTKNKIISSVLCNCNEEVLNSLIQSGVTTPQTLWNELCYCDDKDGYVSYYHNCLTVRNISFLLEKGVDINCKVHNGDFENTILYRAIDDGNIKAVRFLLDHGADIYSKCCEHIYTGRGYNALSYAKYFFKEFRDSNHKDIYLIIKEFSKSHPDKRSIFSKLFG